MKNLSSQTTVDDSLSRITLTKLISLFVCHGIINNFTVVGLPDKEMTAMELGLAHSLSRYKLKFSPDKIDTMIVQVTW